MSTQQESDTDLVIAVKELIQIQDRFESEMSDGGTTGRSDTNDGLNYESPEGTLSRLAPQGISFLI